MGALSLENDLIWRQRAVDRFELPLSKSWNSLSPRRQPPALRAEQDKTRPTTFHVDFLSDQAAEYRLKRQ